MAGGEIGYYTLPVIVSFKGIDAQVEAKLGKSIQDLGKKTGEQLGTAVVAGLDPTKSTKVDAAIKTQTGKKLGEAISTQVTKTVQDSVKGTAGKQMGEAITTSVAKNIDPKVIGKRVEESLSKPQNLDPKVIGKAIERGLTATQNLDAKKIGKTISDNMAGGIDVKHVGSVLKDVLKEPLGEAKKDALDYGKTIGHEILAGDIKTAATDVGNTIQSTTANVNQLGKAIGVNLDGLEHFGRDTAQAIDNAGSKIQDVYDTVQDKVQTTVTDVRNVNEAIRGIGSGSAAERIQSVSTALSTVSTAARHLGVDISSVTTPVQGFVDQAADVAGLVTQVQDIKTTLLGAGPIAPRAGAAAARGLSLVGVGEEGAGAAGAAIGTALGPALAAAAILAGGIYLQSHIDEIWPSTKKPGEINTGPYPTQTPEEGARAAAALPPTPGPPPAGTSWQMGPDGKWKAVPLAPGTPSAATPGWTPPAGTPGAPPPPPPPAPPPASDLAALNKARAAAGLPPLTETGAPAPAPAPAPARVYGPPLPAPAPVQQAMPPVVQRVPGMAEATTGVANIHASSANVSIGSANISGVSVPTPYTGSHQTATGAKSWFQTGGGIGGPSGRDKVPIMATAGEHMLTVADVAAMGGHAGVHSFRNALHRQGGGDIPFDPLSGSAWENQPIVGDLGNVIPGADTLTKAIRQGNAKFNPNLKLDLSTVNKTGPHAGLSYNLSKWWNQLSQGDWPTLPHFDDGGEIKDIKDVAPDVAKAAAEGAAEGVAKGAASLARPAAAGGGGGLGNLLGGGGLQQASGGAGGAGGSGDALQFLSGMIGVGVGGAKETLGLGDVFPDPTANPNFKSIMGLFGALMGPIKGAMAGKLGIQQPGWKPGMPVAAMQGNQPASAGTLGLPFGLGGVDIPAAPAPPAPEAGPGGGPGGPGGNTYNVDASINYHDGATLGIDPAAQRATDTKTQERNLVSTVAPVDPGNH